jgi:hypothetical protein
MRSDPRYVRAEELTQAERALIAPFVTPRRAIDGSIVYPLDEIDAGALWALWREQSAGPLSGDDLDPDIDPPAASAPAPSPAPVNHHAVERDGSSRPALGGEVA